MLYLILAILSSLKLKNHNYQQIEGRYDSYSVDHPTSLSEYGQILTPKKKSHLNAQFSQLRNLPALRTWEHRATLHVMIVWCQEVHVDSGC